MPSEGGPVPGHTYHTPADLISSTHLCTHLSTGCDCGCRIHGDNMQVRPWVADSCLFVFLTIYIHCSLTSAVLGWSHAKPHILRRWAAMLQYQVIVTTEENYEVRTVKAIRCKIISDNKKDRNSSIISFEWNVFLAFNTETPQVFQNPVFRHRTVCKIIKQ